LARAERDVAALTAELGAATDHRDLQAIGERLAAAQGELDQLEERWLELAELQSGGDGG
jgi:hypothetical protein